MSYEGKKILIIIAPEGFRDEELFEPKNVFEENGATVVVSSKNVSVAKGKLGGSVNVDIDISQVKVSDFDAVVFVGGPGAINYFEDETAKKIAKEAYNYKKIVAAICIGPVILANAGVLKEHKATVFSSESENINSKSKGYTGEDVTVDGNIVTANGPVAATKFANEILKLIDTSN